MRKGLRFFFVIAATVSLSTAIARDTQQPQESFGDKLKKLFVRPTPTPKHRRKKKTTPTPTATPTPSRSETIRPAESPWTSPTVPPETQRTEPQAAQPQYFEPVRAMSPRPRPGRSPTPRINVTPRPTTSPTPEETQRVRPMPSLPPLVSPQPSASEKPQPSAIEKPQPSSTAKLSLPPSPKRTGTSNAAVPLTEIKESESYPAPIRKVIELGLDLAAKNLTYKYVSADPARGGMDSSGFVHYVLTNSGIKDAPRDAREQYIWVRKAGNFQAVLAQRDDTFELEALKPGDLLFWSSNFGVSRDPDITQTMIYVGRDKTTNQRLMIGASERANYKNSTKSGVGVFDFKVGRAAPKPNKESGPVFVGYGKIPGLAQ